MKNFLRVTVLAICAIFMTAQASAQGNYDATKMGAIVRYYETAKWSQGSPFNNQCWTDATQQTHAKTGCVPTAFAIIMRHHGFPTEGIGTLKNGLTDVVITDRTYDYSKMPLTNGSGWTAEQQNEVAKLISHLGHAFGVTWGSAETSVSIGNTMSERMQMYFNYNYTPVSNQYAGSGQMYDFETWKNNLKNSLLNGCPVPYASNNQISGGRHMFIVDGFTENDYFHFNFGWGGGTDGWFKLDNITPTGDNYSWLNSSDGYDSKHQAYFNLMPNTTTYTVTATVNDSNKGTVSINNGTAGSTATANLMQGVTATLTAHPAEGYALASWTKNGVVVGSRNRLQVIVGTDANDYVANFDDEANVYVTKDYIISPSTVGLTGTSKESVVNYVTSDEYPAALSLASTATNGTSLSAMSKISDDEIRLYAYDQATSNTTIKYTLSVPDDCIITEYHFDYSLNHTNYPCSISYNGGTITSPGDTEWHSSPTIANNAKTAEFTMTAEKAHSSSNFYIKNFTVTIAKEGANAGGSTPTPVTYTINATAGAGGSVTINGEAVSQKSVNENSTVTVFATPQAGYSFKNWTSGTSTIVSTNATYTFTATANTSLVANFEKQGYTVTVEATEGGSAYIGTKGTTNATVEYGNEVTITAEANDGYQFVKWTDAEGGQISTNASVQVSVTTDVTYTAVFRATDQAGTYPLAGKLFRFKDKGTGKYMNVMNTAWVEGTTSVNVVEKNENSDTQIFLVEESDGGYKIKQRNGNYLNCDRWSTHANAEHGAVVFTFERTSEELKYLIKWDNKNTYNDGRECDDYFKVESNNVFCDAALTAAATWVLEEVIPVTAIAGNGGSVSQTASIVDKDKNVTLTATPNNGYRFVGWYNGETMVSEANPYTFAVTDNINYEARFEAIPSNEKTLTLTFADITYTNYAGSTISSGWGYKAVVNTTPEVTIKVDGSNNNNLGWTTKVNGNKTPYLAKATNFTISVPKPYKIAGYSMTIRGENNDFSGDVTYTATSNNTGTIAISGTTEKTISATGLNNSTINIGVGGTSGTGIFITALEITYVEEEPQELFPDGAYKIYWQADNRGYLAYHATDYPNEAKLAGVTLSGCANLHYGVNDVDLVWYLITASDGKRYLFQAATGKFLGANPFVNSNGIVNKLSPTEAWPIAVEENTHSTRQGHYIITTVINGTKNLLCSGCGTSSFNGGHSVRWLTVNDNNQKDGGAPLQLLPVDNVTVDANIMNAVRAVIEPRTFKFKVEVEGWRNDNPNTHLGTITIGGTPMKLTPEHRTASELTMQLNAGTTLAFTRKYRGFEFNGFYIGETSLGENPTLTAENIAAISDATPLVAKFTATDDVTLFYDDDKFSYRIPAIAKTGTNRLIAVSDYRHSLFDIGRDTHNTGTLQVDLVIRKSDDNGLTWSAKQTIAEGNQSFGYGDAAIAANGENILVMAVAGNVFYHDATATNKQKAYRIYSTNNGDSWEKEEISSNLYTLFPNKYGMFFGSGKLAVDPDFNGTGNARVYGALLLRDGTRSDYNYVVYSDNWGETWNILGGGVAAYADEPKVEILPNGQILLSSRRSGGRTFNVFTYTDKANNAGTWDTAANGCDNGGNSTNGEIICLDAKKSNGKMTKILLQSQPNGNGRRNVSIWYKELTDDNFTASGIASGWTKGLQVSNQLSAYSTMCLQANGEIAFYFEEAPCYADSDQKGYSMVYVPLTIEEATGNAFHNPNADIPLVTFDIELTDAQGNTYCETLDYIPNNAAAVSSYLTTKYPFIELGINGKIENNKYTNNVTLPFTVTASGKNEFWHNIYWPSYTDSYYPVYMSAAADTDEFVGKVKENVAYGYSTYNTLEYEEELGWAVYNVNNRFEFIFKNRLTDKYIQVTDVANSNEQNVKFVDSADDATVFTLLKKTGSYQGEYALVAKVGETTGYLCSTSAGYSWVTHHSSNSHQGAWVKFVDGDYYSMLYDMSWELALQFGVGNEKCVINDDIQDIKDALADYYNNWNTIKLHTIKEYAAIMDEAMSSWPTIEITAGENGRATINNEFEDDGNVVTNKRAPVGYSLTVNALPNDGYKLKNWSKGTDAVSNATDYTFEVEGATSLTANFEVDLANRYFRLYVKGTENCMNIISTDRITSGTSGINTTAKELNKNEQIFFFEESGNNYKLKALNGHYITCENWFANANATESSAATELIFEETGIELEYLIKWDNPGRDDYFKVNDNSHVYSNAAITAAATWVLEEVTLCTTTVAANPAEAGTATVAVGTGTGTNSVRVESGTEVTLAAVANDGYHFVNWTDADGNVVSTNASYTFNITAATELTANFEKRYPEVTGNTNANNYLTSVTTQGGRTNVNYSANTHPGEKVVTIGTVQIGRGESFSMNLIAYSLGAGSASVVREDMRYCHASLFTDFDGDRTFGAAAQTWGVKGPSGTNPYAGGNSNVYGNYDLVMNITANITVPVDAPLGESHVRMIYTNAWKDWPTNGTTTLDKGIVYDIIVEVVEDVEDVTITVGVATENTGTVTINGEGVDSKQVAKDSEVTVVATPASGYHFVNWTDAGGNEVSTDASYTFTASENTSLVANFEADIVYHTITVSTYYNNNGGTVKVGEEDATSVNVIEGNSVKMVATVNDGYEFMGWLKDGILVKNAIGNSMELEIQGPDYTLYEVKASAEYVAVFSKITDFTNLEDGKAYRICAIDESGRPRCIYRDGNTLKWSYDYDNTDVNTIFVAQKNGNGVSLISGLGYHGWKASYMLGNDEEYNPYAVIKVTYGTRDELRTLYVESGTSNGLFQTNTDGAFSFQNSRGGGLTMTAQGEITTDFLFEEVKTYAFQVSAADGSNAKLGTVNLPFATTVPEGVKVYGVDHTEGEQVYMKALELTNNVLPAKTPVLVEAEKAGKFGFAPAPASQAVHETGFAGTLEAEAIPGTTNAYILSYKGVGTHIMLYKLSSTDRTINANKAYFIEATGKASALQFVFGETTDIEEVEREDLEHTIYDLQGRKLSEITEPGIYIIDGKKVWIK